VVKNVYDHGYYAKVDPGSFMVQANRSAAKVALKFKVNDVVTITRSYRSSANVNYINAIGRGPRLIQNGKFTWVCSQHAKDFRPRTAVGWNDDGQIWFITSSRGEDAADLGMRQGGSSTDQMGHWLLALGATEGYLLDGGGSTTMEINIPNSGWKRFDLPDSAWYRGLANGLALKLKN
jgi:exopolysaccharide biosynthesis protein